MIRLTGQACQEQMKLCSDQINRSSMTGVVEAEVCKNQYSVLLGKKSVVCICCYKNSKPIAIDHYNIEFMIVFEQFYLKMWHIASTMLT